MVGIGTGERHESGLALGDLVVAGSSGFGSVVAEAADRERHEGGVELGEPFGGEAEPVEHTGPEVLDQDVGATDQLSEDGRVRLGF